jgi:AsmA protein
MKRVLIALAGILALMILIAWLGPRLLGANVRSRLEADASDALGMEVKVGGRLALRFFPGLHITLEDVRIRNHGVDVASVDEVKLGIELRSLLHKDMKFQDVRFKNARITIERDKSGHFNTDRPPKPDSSSPAADIAKVSFAGSSLFYTDAQFGNNFSAENCNVEANGLKLAPTTPPDVLTTLSFAGHLACAHMRTKNLAASNVRASVSGTDGTFKFDPVTLEILGGHGTGRVVADFTAPEPVYRVHSSISKLQLANFSKTVTPEKIAEGALDFSADLTMRGTPRNGVMPTLMGDASLRGNNLVLDIGDLDKEFSRYETTQSFNLVDVGAFFLAGPLGVALTKGYDYARILKKSEGRTSIPTLISQWKVEHGIAQAQDVALATSENRIAMKGGLDLVNDAYDDVTIALVGPKGCVRVKQRIHGSFRNPEVDKPNVVTAITGPARKLLNKGKRLLGAKCEVFYAGAVQPPK